MNLSFLKKRLFAPLYASFALLVVLLLIQEGISLAVAVFKQQTVDSITQTFQIKRESERLLKAALEQKVALRGHLLNQNDEFLAQYKSGRDTFNTSLENLSQLLQDDPSQKGNLITIETSYDKWERQFANPVQEGSFDPETLAEQSSLDTLREAVNRILNHKKTLLSEQNQRLKRLELLNQLSFSLSGLSIG
ncbi:MAG: CHASE3 domain-containing protein, partial [Cyanobacteria bacterium J06636_16]